MAPTKEIGSMVYRTVMEWRGMEMVQSMRAITRKA